MVHRLMVITVLASLTGCVGGSQRTFDASPERLREAVKVVLQHCPDIEEDGNVIRTGPCTRPISPRIRRSGGAWREWHEVRIIGNTVEVNSNVEDSGLYGHGAHRWERRSSQETEEAVLEAIARQLGKAP